MAKSKGGFVAPKPSGPKAVTYIGMYQRVFVPEAGVWVEQGETKEIPGDLADRLLEQAANWAEGEASAPDKTEAPPTEPEADPDEEGPEEETE